MSQLGNGAGSCALVLQSSTRVPRAVPAYLRLLLNYLYGLDVVAAAKPAEATALAARQGDALRAVFVIQDDEVANRNTLMALGRRGQLPLVLLLPPELAAGHQALAAGMANLRVCGWDQTAGRTEASLQDAIAALFAGSGIVKLPIAGDGLTQEQHQARLQARLRHIATLPTLPAIVLRILRLLKDPATTAEDLERVLLTDPAIVHRLLRLVNSPAFAGTRDGTRWSLKEAVVRLGHRQVGAIAQQVTLINSLVRPERSAFDLRRFWEHAIGCACIADVLYRERLLPLDGELDFDLYWVGALLHDIGRLVLGFLAWEYYEEVVARTRGRDTSFGQAEERLGHAVTHEYLGRVLLLQAGAGDELVELVGTHNTTGRRPAPLVSLVHVADGLTRELGLGYAEQEAATYSASVLAALGIGRDDLARLQERLAPAVVDRVRGITAFSLEG